MDAGQQGQPAAGHLLPVPHHVLRLDRLATVRLAQTGGKDASNLHIAFSLPPPALSKSILSERRRCQVGSTTASRDVPSGRYSHAAALVRNAATGVRELMVMYGGFSIDCTDYCDDLWHYSLPDNVWTRIVNQTRPRPARRWKHAMVDVLDAAVMFGGQGQRLAPAVRWGKARGMRACVGLTARMERGLTPQNPLASVGTAPPAGRGAGHSGERDIRPAEHVRPQQPPLLRRRVGAATLAGLSQYPEDFIPSPWSSNPQRPLPLVGARAENQVYNSTEREWERLYPNCTTCANGTIAEPDGTPDRDPTGPRGRLGASLASVGTSVYLFGGYAYGGLSSFTFQYPTGPVTSYPSLFSKYYLNDLWVLDLVLIFVFFMQPSPAPPSRSRPFVAPACTRRQRCRPKGRAPSPSLNNPILGQVNVTWSKLLPPAGYPSMPSPRYGHSAGISRLQGDVVMLVYGGYTWSDEIGDMWQYNVSSGAWTQVVGEGNFPSRRYQFRCEWGRDVLGWSPHRSLSTNS